MRLKLLIILTVILAVLTAAPCPAQTRAAGGGEDRGRGAASPSDSSAAESLDAGDLLEISASGSAGELIAWSADHFHGGRLSHAIACIRRARFLDPKRFAGPRKDADPEFRRFQNTVVLRSLRAESDSADAAVLLRLARRARRADLNKEATRLLRRAWRLDPGWPEIESAADAWGVRPGAVVRMDLTPALRDSLLLNGVMDEGWQVTAGADDQFLLIPLRYDAATIGQPLSKSLVRGKARRWVYGVRPLRIRAGKPILDWLPREPVYERVEVRSDPDKGLQLVAKNTSGPRMAQGRDPPERIGPRERRLAATGWAGLLIEVPRRLKRLTLVLADDSTHTLDLELLRQTSFPPGAGRSDPASPWVSKLLAVIEPKLDNEAAGAAPYSASASLGIGLLASIRDAPGMPPTAAWSARVEPPVIRAAAREEFGVGPAAWRYFSAGASLSPAARDAFAGLRADAQLAWLRILKDHSPERSVIAVAVAGAILRGSEPVACDEAISYLVGGGASVDWGILSAASRTARWTALSRLDVLADDVTASAMLGGLIQAGDHSLAEPMAYHATRLAVGLLDPEHPILRRWSGLTTDAAKVGLLRMLSAVSLRHVIHDRRIAALVRREIAPTSSPAVREAAHAFIVAQAERVPMPDRHAAVGLLVPRIGGDAYLETLASACLAGRRNTRRAALTCMLRDGYAEEAARRLWSVADRARRERFLTDAMLLDEPATSDGMLAFLGLMLRPGAADSAIVAVDRLRRAAARTAPDDHWRMLAAVRTGVDFSALCELSVELQPPASGAVLRWLNNLAHMTRQERQRFSAARTVIARRDLLGSIDLRRGRLVDGRYRALAIVETVSAVAAGAGRTVWSPPRRRTVELPPVTLRLAAENDTFTVKRAGTVIGSGMALDAPQPARSLEYYYGVMETLSGRPFVGGRISVDTTTATPNADSPRTIGPVALRSATVLDKPVPGTMTLDVGRLLKSAVGAVDDKSVAIPAEIIPARYRLTLRYARFGAYCGTGSRRAMPPNPDAGDVYFLNVKLLLERLD